jgi:diacylglycerol kinase (ATP)
MSKEGARRVKRLARLARRLAKRVRPLARLSANLERIEEARVREIVRSQAEARIRELLPPADQVDPSSKNMLPALLIINSKSGPNRDSLMRVRELVDVLAAHGIATQVRVKLRKSQARREARAAVRAGFPIVIAAGGDGTVAAVARGLIESNAVLGIIPLGTYNNVATSLGIPTDIAQACALIAAAPVRAIDVGEVQARGMQRPRAFLEVGAVGIAAPLGAAGQGFEKGRWEAVTSHLPRAIEMAPSTLGVRVDGQPAVRAAQSLLVVVANAPRAGAGLVLAPEAKLDDGLLDVRVYENMPQPALLSHLLTIKTGTPADDPRVRRVSGRKVVIRSTTSLPVLVETKVVGSTPARFRVRTGALLAITGAGDGLSRPAAQTLLSAIRDGASVPWTPVGTTQVSEIVPRPMATRSAGLQLVNRGRPLGVAVAMGVAIALLPKVSRWIEQRRH